MIIVGKRGEPMPIITDKNAKPVAFHTTTKVPLHLTEQVKRDLDRDVYLGIIEPATINTSTTWCARMVVVAKHDGSLRRTVDFRALNSASQRQTHHTKSPLTLVSEVPSQIKKECV